MPAKAGVSRFDTKTTKGFFIRRRADGAAGQDDHGLHGSHGSRGPALFVVFVSFVVFAFNDGFAVT